MNLTLRGFIKKELWQALRDPRMRALLFVAPIIQMTMFGYALSNEVRNLRLAAYIQQGDAQGGRLRDRLLASGLFIPARGADPDPYQAVLAGQADAALVPPPGGFKRALARGGGEFQLLIDASNATRARSVENYFNAVWQAEMREQSGGQAPPPRLELSVRMLYNPSMETSYFMVPGILAMLLLLVTMTLTSSSITKEKELGTFETLIAAPVAKWEIILGKTLPYVILGMLDIPIIMLFARVIFGVPMRADYWWWQLPLGGLVFICSTVGLGTLVSTIARNQQQAMMSGFLVTFPAQMLSGIIYPLENMPWAIRWIAYLNPLKYFCTLMRNITLKGGDLWVFWMNLWPMALIAAAAVGYSFHRFRQKLN